LYELLGKELIKEKLEKVAFDIEFPLVPVLEDMERTGVKIDVKSLKAFSNELKTLID